MGMHFAPQPLVGLDKCGWLQIVSKSRPKINSFPSLSPRLFSLIILLALNLTTSHCNLIALPFAYSIFYTPLKVNASNLIVVSTLRRLLPRSVLKYSFGCLRLLGEAPGKNQSGHQALLCWTKGHHNPFLIGNQPSINPQSVVGSQPKGNQPKKRQSAGLSVI